MYSMDRKVQQIKKRLELLRKDYEELSYWLECKTASAHALTAISELRKEIKRFEIEGRL